MKWLTIPLFLLALLGIAYFYGAGSARAETTKEDPSVSESRQYSEKDLKGPTGFSFDGTVTLSMNGTPVAVPVSPLGQVNWDGKGRATSAVRTFNFGGAVVLQQIAEGEYQVNPDGTGTARFVVTTQGMTGSPPPGVNLPPIAVETFSFVLTGPDNDLQFIGTGLLDKDTGQPLAAVTVHGVLRKQR
jgi:hypothetical protein